MENQNMIIIALVAIVLIIIGVIAGLSLNNTQNNDTNETNDTLNITLNDSDDSNTTTDNNKKESTSIKSSKSDSEIVGESIKENYQAGDGSHYREVEYKDGNIRQYSSDGKLIGSTYESDQAQLKKDAGNSWAGD